MGEQERKKTDQTEGITLHEINALCTEKVSLFPDRMHDWDDVTRTAAVVAPMIGISENTLDKARLRVGPVPTAILVLYVLEILPKVEQPGAYLNYLVNHKEAVSEAISTLRRKNLSADNSEKVDYSRA